MGVSSIEVSVRRSRATHNGLASSFLSNLEKQLDSPALVTHTPAKPPDRPPSAPRLSADVHTSFALAVDRIALLKIGLDSRDAVLACWRRSHPQFFSANQNSNSCSPELILTVSKLAS